MATNRRPRIQLTPDEQAAFFQPRLLLMDEPLGAL